jgi:hypothetical protein
MRAGTSPQPIQFETGYKAPDSLFLVRLLLSATLLFSLSSCLTQKPVEEVVTTDASRTSALPLQSEAIAREPKLPARDADIEMAGDRIAEAITHLNARRREAAMRALNQSETALYSALRAHAGDNGLSTSLRTTLRDLETAERAVQRGSTEAAKQLATINRILDGLDLERTQGEGGETNETQ